MHYGLKPIISDWTKRIRKLKELLNEFGDPDINVAYVLRCYIRDLNRALPFIVKSGFDLKNYFALFGPWLKQVSSLINQDKYSGAIMNPWGIWRAMGSNVRRAPEPSDSSEEKENEPAPGKNDEKK
jgi:hypothetical protein